MSDEPKLHVENAIVADIRVGLDEAGRLIGALVMQNSKGLVTLGPHVLYAFQPLAERQDTGNVAGHWLYRLMQVTGSPGLAAGVGRTVRILHDGSSILAIGHSVKDDWFRPADEFAAIAERSGVRMAEEVERLHMDIRCAVAAADAHAPADGEPIMDVMQVTDEAA